MIFFLNKVYWVTQKQVIKRGAGIFLILSHYIYRVAVLLFRGEEPMQNVRIPQRYCICRVRSKPKFNVVTWFATTAVWLLVRKGLSSTVNKFTEINVCPVLYFLLLRWHQVFFLGQQELANANINLHTTIQQVRRFCPWMTTTAVHWITVHYLENCSW